MDLKCAKLSVITQTSHSQLGEAVGYCSYRLTHLSIGERFEEEGKLSFVWHWKENSTPQYYSSLFAPLWLRWGQRLLSKPLLQKNIRHIFFQK